jgi:creatinine amidohydrolase
MNQRRISAFMLALALSASGPFSLPAAGQDLPVRYEELSTPDFISAVQKAQAVCIIPLGILEKHGPHLPLGTDLLTARAISIRAAQKEYAIVFPEFFVGQIFEARHQPGTIAYSRELMLDMLQETCDELGRNGLRKIILVNGHGGNGALVEFFCQSQLAGKKDYAVYLFKPSGQAEKMKAERTAGLRKTKLDGHAGEEETSVMLALRPELVRLDRAEDESGADLDRLSGLKHAYTGIWWYAGQPNHYRGFGGAGSRELGELVLELETGLLVDMIRSVKADRTTLELQDRFFKDAASPLTTPQGKQKK